MAVPAVDTNESAWPTCRRRDWRIPNSVFAELLSTTGSMTDLFFKGGGIRMGAAVDTCPVAFCKRSQHSTALWER